MIHIPRPTVPDFMIEPDSKWDKENKKALEFYSVETEESFKFKAYSDKKVKAELEKVFKKCAYCESSYQASSDGDIEHFRPKGKIGDIDKKPGYYWLANDWDNLFLSCQHCNQLRKQILYTTDEIVSVGKKDQFPLSDESVRMMTPDDKIEDEETARLLLNPCIDNPMEHFEYSELDPVMIPQTDMAETSINVYGLERIKLVKSRKEVKIHLFQQMQLTKNILEIWNDHPEDVNLKTTYEDAFNLMMSFTGADKPYAGMCRYYVKKFLDENELI